MSPTEPNGSVGILQSACCVDGISTCYLCWKFFCSTALYSFRHGISLGTDGHVAMCAHAHASCRVALCAKQIRTHLCCNPITTTSLRSANFSSCLHVKRTSPT